MLLPLSPSCCLHLKPPRKTTSFSCGWKPSFTDQQWRQNSHGLEFIWGEKLLSSLSTWGIGGPCNYFVQVFDQTQIISAIRYCKEHSLRYMVIGKGSNCLIDDMGYDGCVMLNRMEFLDKIEPGLYRVGSGYPFNRIGVQSANEGFTGLEFAGGIPGTVSGATFMNAGANGQETGAAIVAVEIITSEVTFQLNVLETARYRQQCYMERRKVTQPLGNLSAGSVFRNPANLGVSAAELIERSGRKGLKIGGAVVSKKHANFGIKLKEEILYVPPCSGNTDPMVLIMVTSSKASTNNCIGLKLL